MDAAAVPTRGRNIEPWQQAGWDALCGDAPHVLLAGGARSGKTYLIVKFLCIRARGAPSATQCVLRLHFNHLKASIIYDTLPQVMRTEWPGVEYHLNKSDWYVDLCGYERGRIYFGGLDDKERTEKILGQGHSTIYENEASQLSYGSRNKAVTRLSQQAKTSSGGILRLKEVVDENPPIQGHWTHQCWIKGRDPSTGKPLDNPFDYSMVYMNPKDNPYIPEATKTILRNLPPRERKRFWEGLFGDAVEGPLWTYESIERMRDESATPVLVRIVVSVDPSGCHGPEDKRSDEIGIVVAGIDNKGRVYILEDASGRYSPQGPDGWGVLVKRLYYKHKADFVVAEENFGGAMVQAVIQATDSGIPYKHVNAARGKTVRADPVATLSDKGLVKLVGMFPEMEQQMLQFSTNGFSGDKSPDRVDAMVWAVWELAIERVAGQGLLEWYMQQAALGKEGFKPPPDPTKVETVPGEPVLLSAPTHITGTIYTLSGNLYQVESGKLLAAPIDVEELVRMGFRRADQ